MSVSLERIQRTLRVVGAVLAVALLCMVCFARQPEVFAVWSDNSVINDTASPVVNSANDCSNGVTKDSCGIVKIVVDITNVLSALVGVVVVLSIVIAGIQYSTAGGNPQTVAKSKKRIINALLALLIYIFMYSFLQWLIPGGLF